MLNKNISIPCDILLLKGECMVNECNITGETDPISKRALENNTE